VFRESCVPGAGPGEIAGRRTDDDTNYPLPPGLGRFPLRHVDDFADKVSARWLQHGGIMLPMYQSEALWVNFTTRYGRGEYPFAVKIATGKINAVSGEEWQNGLHRDPQDYLVAPNQPWLDGYCVERGIIRQFVAMPLGAGYTAEEQLTGKAEHGGLQILVCPMKADVYARLFEPREELKAHSVYDLCSAACEASYDMGLAPGGRMRQQIFEDPYDLQDWDTRHAARCFVHLANSLVWRQITGSNPPTCPFTAAEYEAHGLPWFEYYDESAKAVAGADRLSGMKSVRTMGAAKGDVPLPENEPVTPQRVIELRRHLKKDQVRETVF